MADLQKIKQWAADPANANDPRLPAVKSKLASLDAPQTPADPRGNMKYLDAVSDALPATGALVGGALAAPVAAAGAVPSFGVSALLIPGAGAAGYGGGEFLKRLIDRVSGRPGQPAPVDVPASSARGAAEAMNAFSAGSVVGKAADANRYTESVYSALKGGPTPYAPLSDETLGAVGSRMVPPGRPVDMVTSPPIGKQAQIGGKYATPRVAAATKVGATTLRNMGDQAADDVALFNAGTRAERAIPNIEQAMRGNVTPLAKASGRAIDATRAAMPDYAAQIDASTEPPTQLVKAPGENVVNNAFRNPATQSTVISDPSTMHALAEMKSLGLRNKVMGNVLGKEWFALTKAEEAGLTPQLAAGRQVDADTLQGLSEALQRQRGGIAQRTPEGFGRKLYEDVKQKMAGPQSTMMGLRGETPEDAVLNNSKRLMEIERLRRGMAPLDTQAAAQATQGVERPAMRALASPNAQALSGAEFEAIRRLLNGDQ